MRRHSNVKYGFARDLMSGVNRPEKGKSDENVLLFQNLMDHLFCDLNFCCLQKSGSRNMVREIWFEKSGSRKVVDQKKRWFYTINPAFFRLEKSG